MEAERAVDGALVGILGWSRRRTAFPRNRPHLAIAINQNEPREVLRTYTEASSDERVHSDMNSMLWLFTASGMKMSGRVRAKETAHRGETLEGTSLRGHLDSQLLPEHSMVS